MINPMILAFNIISYFIGIFPCILHDFIWGGGGGGGGGIIIVEKGLVAEF